jgi:AraC-like DNA-binding protein
MLRPASHRSRRGRGYRERASHSSTGRSRCSHAHIRFREPGDRDTLTVQQLRQINEYLRADLTTDLSLADLGHMTRVFRQRLAITPARYRQNA